MDYNVYAVQRPTLQPAMRLIASITQTDPAVVTTTFAHLYKSGAIVRIRVPEACGMPQINGKTGSITVTGATTFTIDIDATTFEPFSVPVGLGPRVDIAAQVTPVGEINSKLNSATQNVLPYTS